MEPRPRIRLIHWNAEEAAERAARLRGFEVDYSPVTQGSLRSLKERPPEAFVIDLSRLPSGGRDIAIALRHSRATRAIPIVFVGGDPVKVARIRGRLPDAIYTTWATVHGSLRRAIASPPPVRVVPRSSLDGYSGTPLPKKLGIRPHASIALVGAPPEFERTLGALPEGVEVRRNPQGPRDITIWFVRSRADLGRTLPRMTKFSDHGGLWIAWPKQSSGEATDITQALVRQAGLAAGLVDFKICAIDATWSGLRFSRKSS